MNKIPKEHIEFLEFVSNKIYSESPGWWQLDLIAKEYKKETSINLSIETVRHIADLYKNRFFKTSIESDLKIFPLPEIKQEIETYGSLSKYLTSLIQENKKATNKKIWITISPIAINVLILIVAVIFGVLSVISNYKADKLEAELETKNIELNKKDSIIFELKKQLINNDTIEIKH